MHSISQNLLNVISRGPAVVPLLRPPKSLLTDGLISDVPLRICSLRCIFHWTNCLHLVTRIWGLAYLQNPLLSRWLSA